MAHCQSIDVVLFASPDVCQRNSLMKVQKEILKWWQASSGKHRTALLTNSDCVALVTSFNLSNPIGYSIAPPELLRLLGY